MDYYNIQYYLESEETDCGVKPLFMHLPCTYEVTTDREVAETWFNNAVKMCSRTWLGYKLLRVDDSDTMFSIKRAVFECNEPAYLKGTYMIELQKFPHNIME